jgi:HK97 family phage major capsid protein
MARLIELKQQRKFALDKAESIIQAAETSKRELTPNESAEVDTCMTAVHALNVQVSGIEKTNTISKMMSSTGTLLTDGPRKFQLGSEGVGVQLSEDYPAAFGEYIKSGGKRMDAALYEGSESAGGYAVPVVVDDQIVPLAPAEMSVRQLASVIPTTSDILIPTKTSFSVAALKTELSSFGSTAPTIGQLRLSAFMIGQQNDVSWELVQDVPVFQSFLVQDMILAQQMLEESYYVTGSGTGQPQGLIGNVGAGTTEEPDTSGNMVTISGSLT